MCSCQIYYSNNKNVSLLLYCVGDSICNKNCIYFLYYIVLEQNIYLKELNIWSLDNSWTSSILRKKLFRCQESRQLQSILQELIEHSNNTRALVLIQYIITGQSHAVEKQRVVEKQQNPVENSASHLRTADTKRYSSIYEKSGRFQCKAHPRRLIKIYIKEVR